MHAGWGDAPRAAHQEARPTLSTLISEVVVDVEQHVAHAERLRRTTQGRIDVEGKRKTLRRRTGVPLVIIKGHRLLAAAELRHRGRRESAYVERVAYVDVAQTTVLID